MLRRAAEKLGLRYSPAILNDDRSIDAQIMVPVERGVSTIKTIRKLETALHYRKKEFPYKLWFAVGLIGSSREPEHREQYDQYLGLLAVMSYPTESAALVFLTAREKLVKPLEKAWKRKTEQVFLRINWNPSGENPGKGVHSRDI